MNNALHRMRSAGWSVAVHNDYRQNGATLTFWLFTHPNGTWVRGEGVSDERAIEAAEAHARMLGRETHAHVGPCHPDCPGIRGVRYEQPLPHGHGDVMVCGELGPYSAVMGGRGCEKPKGHDGRHTVTETTSTGWEVRS